MFGTRRAGRWLQAVHAGHARTFASDATWARMRFAASHQSHFQEGPPAQAAVVVDRWNPVPFGGRGLGRLLAAVLAGHRDDEVERLGPAVVIADDQVRDVPLSAVARRCSPGYEAGEPGLGSSTSTSAAHQM